MIRCVCLLACFSAAVISWAQPFDPFQGPRPLAILIQTNPWAMAIGSDTPTIAVYEDGQVIFIQKEKERSFYVHKQLTPKELEMVHKQLASFGDYSQVKTNYNLAPNITDMPKTRIYVNLNGKEMATSIYGLLLPGTRLPGYTAFDRKGQADTLPAVLRELCDYLVNLKFADAAEWTPQYVEVMIWDYSYAPQKSIHWPKSWPGLQSPHTIKRGDSYSIFLPGKELPQLRAFLKTQKEKGAVEIGGKKWTVSARYTFPSEPVWGKAFRNIRDPD
jgi:hypothetical protein